MKERPILMSGPLVVRTLDDVDPKWQTRRVIKPQPPSVEAVREKSGSDYHWFRDRDPEFRVAGPVWAVRELMGQQDNHGNVKIRCPYGVPGDRLWVREAWRLAEMDGTDDGEVCDGKIAYRADGALMGMQLDYSWALDHVDVSHPEPKWRPSIHMPRWASRLTLEVTDVRVERVQDITPKDALAEGINIDNLDCVDDLCFGGRGCPNCESQAPEMFEELWDSINAKRGFGWDVNPWVWCISFRRIDG